MPNTHLDKSVLGVRHATDIRDVQDALHGVGRAFDHNEAGVV